MMDAHCHPHLAGKQLPEPGHQPEIALVNGTREEDWDAVLAFCESRPRHRLASIGLHPWYLKDALPGWLLRLRHLLRSSAAAIGECGLDRPGARNVPMAQQREALLSQLHLAREEARVVSLHCVGAWGHLLDCLEQTGPLPCPFLLHSVACPPEMLPDFLARGALCSVSFRSPDSLISLIPDEQLLLETDYPARKDTPIRWGEQLRLQQERLAKMGKQALGEELLLKHLRAPLADSP